MDRAKPFREEDRAARISSSIRKRDKQAICAKGGGLDKLINWSFAADALSKGSDQVECLRAELSFFITIKGSHQQRLATAKSEVVI